MDKADIERIIFYYLCGDKMADKMTDTASMAHEDFENITYILHKLKFYDLINEIQDDYNNQFLYEINDAESEYLHMREDSLIYRRWLQEFCDKAPTEELKDILKEIFE